MEFIIFTILFLLVLTPAFYAARKKTTIKNAKRSLIVNLTCFAALCLAIMAFPFCMPAFAAEPEAAEAAVSGLKYIGAGIAVGLSGIGGGFAVASSATAAIGALSENPKTFGKSIVIVGLAEGIAIYGMIIGIMILSN